MEAEQQVAQLPEINQCQVCEVIPVRFGLDLKCLAIRLKAWSSEDKEGTRHLKKLKVLPLGQDGLVAYVLTCFPSQNFCSKGTLQCSHPNLYEWFQMETGLDALALDFYSGRILKQIAQARYYIEVLTQMGRQLSNSVPLLKFGNEKEVEKKIEAPQLKQDPINAEIKNEHPPVKYENPYPNQELVQYQYYISMMNYNQPYDPIFSGFPPQN